MPAICVIDILDCMARIHVTRDELAAHAVA
jgi:hypothetical protein